MKKFTTRQILDYQESLCITVAILFAFAISLSFDINNGCWIPMTVGLMFLATDQGQGAIIQKTKDRAISEQFDNKQDNCTDNIELAMNEIKHSIYRLFF